MGRNESEVISLRRLTRFSYLNTNPLWQIYRFIKRSRILKQALLIEFTRYLPLLPLKRWIYIHALKMNIGARTAFAYKVMPDLLHPELITIGENCVIGYNTTILTHEFLVDRYQVGSVVIGDHTLIGANVTILAGVTIGSNVKVAAGCVVSKDIPDGAVAKGNPMQISTS